LRYSLFLGCWIQTQQYGYEMSTRSVLPRLGVDLEYLEGFSCCGYPLRSLNDSVWFYLSARNIAVSEAEGLDMLPLCNGCYASLCEVKHYMDTDAELRESVNEKLAVEDLEYKGNRRVNHILEVLHRDIGVERIRASVTRPLGGLSLATHCGCHAIRPSGVKYTDDPEDPVMLDEVTRATGAEAGYYPEKLDCCGASLVMTNNEAAFKLTGAKLQAVKRAGFSGMVTNCPFCFKMYDSRQDAAGRLIDDDLSLPVFYVTQLLGLAMGVDAFELGLKFNSSPVGRILERLEAA